MLAAFYEGIFMLNKLSLKTMVAVTTLTLLSSSVYAGTATNTVAVSATVVNTCTITTGSVAYGTVDPTLNTNIDQSGTFSVTCTSGAAWTIGLDNGSNVLTGQRRLRVGATTNYLNYNLYTDAGRATAWTTAAPLAGTGDGLAQTQTIFARIPSGQTTAPAGSYVDTVSATINF